jgi:predicted metal-dependent HD superfamily phosphohydrolase
MIGEVEDRWRETWALLGRSPAPGGLGPLIARYAVPHRAYHNLGHVLACLELAKTVRGQLAQPGLTELALWYHDVVYEPRRSDNEEESASLAAHALAGQLQPQAVAGIERLILATKHLAPPAAQPSTAVAGPAGHTTDADYLVDIDLAILGAEPAQFDAYEGAIRREYRWVPGPLYRRGRGQVLESFLSRSRIYSTDQFHRRLEAAARANLARSLTKKRSAPPARKPS